MSESNSPEDIQRRIEQTRAELSSDVDALGDKVSPSRIVERRVNLARGAVSSLRDRVMGSDSDSDGSGVGDKAQSAFGSVQSAASSVADTATSAPETIRRQAQGNPLAAGLVAFGVGLLASSLLPASSSEQRLATQVKDKATDVGQPLVEQAQQAAKEVAGNLQQPAQEALDQVKSTASEGASSTAEHAKSAAQDVKEQASSSS